eukprot:gene14807-6551_t
MTSDGDCGLRFERTRGWVTGPQELFELVYGGTTEWDEAAPIEGGTATTAAARPLEPGAGLE